MATVNVRILEAWNGYKAGSTLVVTERTFYETRAKGIKMNLIAESSGTEPIKKKVTKKEVEILHDRPFLIDEEE